MTSLDLAVIGNCSFSALLDRHARITWCCLPRFDSDPRFCTLLDDPGDGGRGFFDIELFGLARSEQRYRDNSAVLETMLLDENGGAVRVTDFAPRFKNFGRTFRPSMLVRIIEPVSGSPRLRIRLRPTYGYGTGVPEITRGSNHVRYVMPDLTLRLTTDGPITYVTEEVPFVLERPIDLLLGPDESLAESCAQTARDFLERTDEYWREWCRYLSLPFEWQDPVIRAAITLKLSNFEESGAVIAAATTSIPEAADTERTWDYRYCWLRDSYFVVSALNALGVTRTMEGYLDYITNIVAGSKDGYLQPVFGITQERDIEERLVDSLKGYRGMGPVRVGNSAYNQVQNDGYGSVILACAQSFFDRRLSRQGDAASFRRLEALGEQAIKRWNLPDSGLWELRGREDVHTYSSVMCWAACDRLGRIAAHIGLEDRATYWSRHAKEIRAGVLEHAWRPDIESFSAVFDSDVIDASLLLLPQLGFLPADDPRFLGTLAQVETKLRRGPYVFRYTEADSFGVPKTAFNVCSFWYIDALAAVGRKEEARELFDTMLDTRNPLGLLSEDTDPATRELWGNFPQTYSMVGLIHSAMRLSKPWEEAF